MLYDPDFASPNKPCPKPPSGPDFAFLDKRRHEHPPVGGWTWVYIVNLPVALFLGALVTTANGAVGMWLGVLALFLVGRRACFVARESMLTVVYGGWVVAAFQFFPMGQIAAGLVGVGVAQGSMGLAHHDLGPIDTALGGFMATIVTGLLLIFAAAVLGLLTRGLIRLKLPANQRIVIIKDR